MLFITEINLIYSRLLYLTDMYLYTDIFTGRRDIFFLIIFNNNFLLNLMFWESDIKNGQ